MRDIDCFLFSYIVNLSLISHLFPKGILAPDNACQVSIINPYTNRLLSMLSMYKTKKLNLAPYYAVEETLTTSGSRLTPLPPAAMVRAGECWALAGALLGADMLMEFSMYLLSEGSTTPSALLRTQLERFHGLPPFTVESP